MLVGQMPNEPQRPREDTVDALLETVRELLRAEEARATSLNTRGSGLAGFVGLIVSLSASLGQRALSVDLTVRRNPHSRGLRSMSSRRAPSPTASGEAVTDEPRGEPEDRETMPASEDDEAGPAPDEAGPSPFPRAETEEVLGSDDFPNRGSSRYPARK